MRHFLACEKSKMSLFSKKKKLPVSKLAKMGMASHPHHLMGVAGHLLSPNGGDRNHGDILGNLVIKCHMRGTCPAYHPKRNL